MEDQQTKQGRDARKLYRRPALKVYGTIETLTKTSTHTGSKTDTRGDFVTDSRTH